MGNTKLANPAPLGLMGFGMTTILLNLANSGLFAFDVAILAMGIFYGGIAQIFAGLLEYKKGNTFGLTAFTSYGSFWLTLVAILLMPKMGLADAPNAHFLGMYLGLWGIFTLFMFFGTLKAARMLQFVFLSLTVLFALLAIGHLVDNEGIVKVAGWIGLICGASAIYLAMGEVLNEQFGRTVLPIGEPPCDRAAAGHHRQTLLSAAAPLPATSPPSAPDAARYLIPSPSATRPVHTRPGPSATPPSAS